ncbi:tetratricopeptide repeat protein [Neisseria sicca]|uniref:tetratricopeptide repeat protein n=1 Tax=Neisseria sicca TaxID=490 RepID=UPI000D30C4DD|nr:tetratricopeptide repeat protein [Neisseria sicca]
MVNQKTSVSTGNINSNGGNISIGNQQYITNIFHSSEWKKMEEEKEKLEKDIKFCESLLLKEGNCDDEGIIKRLSEAKNDLKNKLKEMGDFKHGILQLAETFSKIEIDSERLQEAYKLFLEGKYSEARTILMVEQALNEHEDLLKKREKLSQDIEENEKKLKQKAKESFLLANLQAVNYSIGALRVDEASKYFELSIKEDRCFDYLINYAEFLLQNSKLHKAEEICAEATSFAREICNENEYKGKEYLAYALMVHTQILIAFTDRLFLAEEKAREALKIYSSLQAMFGRFIIQVIEIQVQLANILDELGKYQDAEVFYKKGIEFFEKYRPKNEELLAQILHNYAILLSKDFSRFDEAKECLYKSLKIREDLVNTDTDWVVKNISIARTLLSLGNLLSKQNNSWFKARDCYNKALIILNELSQKGYYEYQREEAKILSNLAKLLNDMARMDVSIYPEAEKVYLLAIDKHKKLKEIEPSVYPHHLSRVLQNYGTLLMELENDQEAEKNFLEAIRILESIRGGDNLEVVDDIVLVKANLAELYEKYNKYDKFEELCIDILEKMILLFTNNPKFYERSLKKTINYINSFLQAHKIENEKLFNMCVNASDLLAKYEQKIKRRKLYY